jgi:hypothetical protein
MSHKHRRHEPFHLNCIPALKLDKMLMNDGLYLTMSVETLRLYLVACWYISVFRQGFVRLKYKDFEDVGWSREQVNASAAELEDAGLLRVRPQQHYLEVTLPDRTIGRIKDPPAI